MADERHASTMRAKFSRVYTLLGQRTLLINTATLLSGSVLSLIASLAFAPVLARIYSPADFGALGVYVGVVSIGSVLAALRYEQAIVLPESDADGRGLLWLSLGLVLAASLIVAVFSLLLFVGAPELHDDVRSALLWLAPGMFATAAYQVLVFWRVRSGEYMQVSYTRVIRSVAIGSSQTALALVGAGAGGLIAGQVAGQLAALGAVWSKGRDAGNSTPRSLPRKGELLRLAREHQNFPMYDLPQAALNSVSQQAPVFLLASLASASSAGLFVMAIRVLMLPVTMAGQSVRPVLLQKTSATKNRGECIRPIILSGVLALALIGALPMTILLLAGPWLFELFLGREWREAGLYASIMAPWLFLVFIKEAVMALVPVLGAQRMMLKTEAASLIARVLGIALGAAVGGAVGAVVVLSAIGSVVNMFVIWRLMDRARIHDASVGRAVA